MSISPRTSRRAAPMLVGVLVTILMLTVYAGQRIAIRWAHENPETSYPEAMDHFTAERIESLLAAVTDAAGMSGTPYSIKLANNGTATVSVCFPGAKGLLRYDVSPDGGTTSAGGGAGCIGGFDAATIGAQPMLVALGKAIDPSYDGLVSAAYDAHGGLTPVVDVVPDGAALMRYTLNGSRVGKIVDVTDSVDVQIAFDHLLAASGVDALQSVCVMLREPQVSIAGVVGAADSATASSWRFSSFAQRMPSVTARSSGYFAAHEVDLPAIVERSAAISALFANTPKVKLACVEPGAGADPVVRYELMNGLHTTSHQVWTTLDGAVIAKE